MADTYLTIRADLAVVLARLPDHALRLFLALAGRAASDLVVPVTDAELASQCDLTINQVHAGLDYLTSDHDGVPVLAKWGTTKGQKAIKVHPDWIGQRKRAIPYSQAVDPDQRLHDLEDEVRRLSVALARAQSGESSNVGQVLKGEARDIAVEVEGFYGKSLTPAEAFYLGSLVAQYGPSRVIHEFRAAHNTRDPLRTAYARLRNGARGKPANQKPTDPAFKPIKYRALDSA